MAMQFNLNALSRFSNVNFGDNDAIANLDNGNGLVQNEKLGFILTRKFRGAVAERQNNAVRTELLKALANAFGIKDGIAVANGKTTFTDKTSEPIKQKVGELLKDLVKKSVDLFIHTMESNHGKMYKSVTDIVSAEGESVEETLSRLDNLSGTISRVDQYWQHKQNQPAQEDEGDVFEENHEEYLID